MTHGRRALILFVAILFLVSVVLPAVALTGSISPDPLFIHLQVGSFDPLQAGGAQEPAVPATPGLPDDLLQAPPDEGSGYYVVQFQGPILQEWSAELRARGAELLEYIPDYAYVVRLPVGALDAVRAIPSVRWLGPWLPAYRLEPSLLAMLAATEQGQAGAQEPVEVRLATYPGVGVDNLLAEMARLGVDPGPVTRSDWGSTLRFFATPSQIVGLSRLPDVRWIEPFMPRELFNDRAQANWLASTQAIWDLGLYGQGQVVAVADSGLDTGNINTVHLDVRGRINQGIGLGRPGNWSDPNGHGTHVTGSVLGNGVRSGSNPASHQYAGSKAGSAPEARLIMQSLLDTQGGLGGIPNDLNNLFQQAYDGGARIHTNSWGAPEDGAYTLDSQQVDQFNWNRKDMTILFAAGNEGADVNPSNGVVDEGSVGSPATAKNAIAVGASEGQRVTDSNDTWFWYGFTRDPIRTDHTSDNHWGMAAFSSRGPTDDGRNKPDLVTAGTNIDSLRSSLASGSGDYRLLSGTSMATPLTAGMAALVRQWYQQSRGLSNPSAALIKATLLNGAMRITPGQYGTGATQEIPNSWPNNVAGWGRTNVKHSIAPASPRVVWFRQHGGLATGQTVTYRFQHSPGVLSEQALAEIAAGSVLSPGELWVPSVQPELASVNVLESSVPPGAIITVEASGFPASQAATVTLDGASLGQLSGNASGSWRFRIFLNTESTRGSHTVVISAGGVSANDTFQVAGGKDGTFRATLVWTDYPGSTAASRQLVNDLDLTVTGPGGGTSGGNNTTDRINNVEEVWLQNAGPGVYEVRVRAHNVPNGPQPFALVVSGDNLVEVGQGTPTPTPTRTPTRTPGASVDVYLPMILRSEIQTPPPLPTPTPTSTPPSVWTVLTAENFEGAFPKAGWQLFDDQAGSGEYFWGKRGCRPYGGAYSGWAVGGGASGAGQSCNASYPNNAESWMVYGPFSLAGASDAEMVFRYWLNTERTYDGLFWGASVNGSQFYGQTVTGSSQSWQRSELDLTNVPTLGDLRGRGQVWVAMVFFSDVSITYPEGAYVDEIVLQKRSGGSASVSADVATGCVALPLQGPEDKGLDPQRQSLNQDHSSSSPCAVFELSGVGGP